jgi:hypothetical protein
MLAIESGALLDALDDADRTVAQILSERKSAAAQLDEAIDAANVRLGESESRRADQQDVVKAASEDLDAAEGQAQARLSADAAYQAQLKATEDADFVAEQAEDKAEAAQRDRIDKGRPYEDDALFSYLWNRGYGRAEYSAWPLARWLDGKVAKLCDYEAARRDYGLLIEIPARLREHATRMRAEFDQQVEALRALEAAAAEEANVPALAAAEEANVPALAEELDKQERQIEDVDSAIAEREDALRALVRERVQFANGNDTYYMRCIEILRDAMRRQGFGLLQERASRTHEPEDDRLVRRLVELEDDMKRREQDLADYRSVYERESLRVHEIEDVRRRFKSARFDDTRSEFLDAALFTLVLQRLLNGAVRPDDAWKAIRRQQRTRAVHADPRFGTRRFPRAPRSGPWRRPPGGGGFGGGGFGSGGGFGGGGFKSGGGF